MPFYRFPTKRRRSRRRTAPRRGKTRTVMGDWKVSGLRSAKTRASFVRTVSALKHNKISKIVPETPQKGLVSQGIQGIKRARDTWADLDENDRKVARNIFGDIKDGVVDWATNKLSEYVGGAAGAAGAAGAVVVYRQANAAVQMQIDH